MTGAIVSKINEIQIGDTKLTQNKQQHNLKYQLPDPENSNM